VLATSPELSSQNLSLFHTHVKEVLKTFPGADIVMADRTGQQIINSYKNFGDVLPVRNVPDIVNQVFETGKPQISGIFYGAVSKRPLIGIDVPVIQGDRVIYDLAMTFPPDRVRDILLRGNLPNDWLGFILDPACCMEAA